MDHSDFDDGHVRLDAKEFMQQRAALAVAGRLAPNGTKPRLSATEFQMAQAISRGELEVQPVARRDHYGV